MLYDAHCHLDFSLDPAGLARGLQDEGVRVVSATVTPTGFEQAVGLLESRPHVRLGLGFHPWWVSDGRLSGSDIERFAMLASKEEVRHISEIGLDFAPRRLASSVSGGTANSEDAARALQMDCLEAVLAAVDVVANRYISLHSVKAEKELLDILDAHVMTSRHDCVFHGYAGSQDQLMRLLDRGCYVSVGPRMLSTKRGREYAKAIPADRILLETDAPSAPGGSLSAACVAGMLQDAIAFIADLRRLDGERRDCFFELVAETSKRVLRF